jgi:hypothetical protein
MRQDHFLARFIIKIQEFCILMTFFNSSHQQLFIFINFTHFPLYLILLFFKKRKINFPIKIPNKNFVDIFSLDFYK